MLVLNILSVLLLIGFVSFVWFSTSKQNWFNFSIANLFNNKNNYKIKRKNFLSNILYLDDDNHLTYGFFKVANKLDKECNELNLINILRNNTKHTVLKEKIIGKILNPLMFKDVHNLINELDNEINQQQDSHLLTFKPTNDKLHVTILCNRQHDQDSSKINLVELGNDESKKLKESNINIANNGKSLKNEIFTINEIVFNIKDKSIFLADKNKKINIHDVRKMNKLDIYQFFYQQTDCHFLLGEKAYTPEQMMLLIGFWKLFDSFKKYENCQKASEHCFININKLSVKIDYNKALKHIDIINLINTHIEIFILFKFLSFGKNKSYKTIKRPVYDFLASIFPSMNIQYEAFDYAYSLLKIDNLFNLNHFNQNDYLDTYLLDFILNNINEKYTNDIKEKIITIINLIENQNDDKTIQNYILTKLNLIKLDKVVKLTQLISNH